MKLNSFVSKFLTNKLVLNVVSFLALFNVIGYLVIGNINAILYFIVFAILVRYFSKNMTIVLGVPLIVVNLLAARTNILEGLENNLKSNNANTKMPQNLDSDQKKINNIVKNNHNKPDKKSEQGLSMQPLDENANLDNNAAQETGSEQQGFESGRRKNRGYNIDYATTVEDAYDELNNILGSDGIQRLTSDTQNLMKQQIQLSKAMEGMAPIIETIQPMVKQLQGMMGQMGDEKGLGGIMKMAKNLSGPNN